MSDGATRRWQVVAGVCVLLLITTAISAFAVDLGAARPDPVPFEDTVKLGVTEEIEQAAEHRGASIPRVEVFYSQYRYVVGYAGVAQAVSALDEPGREQQFGYPLAVYASDYAGRSPGCANGTLTAATNPDWVSVTDAQFVVGSRATLAGESVVVPFSSGDDAAAFADACGGRVVNWDELRRNPPPVPSAAGVKSQVDDRRARADRQVAAVDPLLDREESVVVGRDAPTIEAAVAAAPPNTTVVVPSGTYAEHVTVDKPLTLRGENATLDGGGEGTVIDVRADDVAVTGVTIRGVGNATRAENASGSGDWDAPIQQGYGGGDAGIDARNVSGLYVHDVTIHTPANGVLVRRAPGAVVDDLRVYGSEEWLDGFMGVIAMNDAVVVQNSYVEGGRDGVYLHRAHGTVVRNNTFLDHRFGVHLMYTSDTLVADNVARGQEGSGVVVMTRPTANAIVGNDVRHANGGIFVGGAQSYVAENVVVDTDRGMVAYATQTTYEHNVLYENEVGFAASTVVPSNRVVANDFVDNDRHATAGPGPLRIYTEDGRGNYWDGAYDMAPDGGDGTLSRPYSPTDELDRRLHRTDAAVTLSAAPTIRGLRAFRGTTPGFRKASIIDLAPLRRPANPERLAQARNETDTERRAA
ncbi:NosD domain-containing protein [Haloplanus aerogenes]|uniref:Copper-binding protein n=1 Tax=Haloplanus aerogenes TaxID=660522 RepID=A0A3M0DT81_9EURY|nr:NosD domain-containing protein [Haloplanus aerogenes]AZH25659.1 copper-binding protein [Haloplanus aerogenes]RMB25388.1 parallel beta-helix repeat protein [Haloplanus aerogenes]